MRLTWLLPAAWGLATLAALPIAVHLLARPRLRQVRFPTLRFLDATAAPARRRWHVRERLLLALRVAMVVAVAAALARPVLVTPARQEAWNAATARAVVTVPGVADGPEVRQVSGEDAEVARRVVTGDVRQGIADAAAWLEVQPQVRREIVVVAPLARGVLGTGDVAALPAGVGLRLVRAGALPPAAQPRERARREDGRVWRVQETVTFEEAGTSVRETARTLAGDDVVPLRAPAGDDAAAQAARRALLGRGIILPPGDAAASPVVWSGDVQSLARAVDARAAVPEAAMVEPAPASDAEVQRLTRATAPSGDAPPRDTGDRRVAWALVLTLLAAETWLRSRTP